MQTLATDPVIADTLSVTHVPLARELLHADPGAELRWGNRTADHHIIVLSGTCRVLGRQIHAGASAYIPAGFDHSVKAGGWGCTFLSMDGSA